MATLLEIIGNARFTPPFVRKRLADFLCIPAFTNLVHYGPEFNQELMAAWVRGAGGNTMTALATLLQLGRVIHPRSRICLPVSMMPGKSSASSLSGTFGTKHILVKAIICGRRMTIGMATITCLMPILVAMRITGSDCLPLRRGVLAFADVASINRSTIGEDVVDEDERLGERVNLPGLRGAVDRLTGDKNRQLSVGTQEEASVETNAASPGAVPGYPIQVCRGEFRTNVLRGNNDRQKMSIGDPRYHWPMTKSRKVAGLDGHETEVL